jgi:hypothetical protein
LPLNVDEQGCLPSLVEQEEAAERLAVQWAERGYQGNYSPPTTATAVALGAVPASTAAGLPPQILGSGVITTTAACSRRCIICFQLLNRCMFAPTIAATCLRSAHCSAATAAAASCAAAAAAAYIAAVAPAAAATATCAATNRSPAAAAPSPAAVLCCCLLWAL